MIAKWFQVAIAVVMMSALALPGAAQDNDDEHHDWTYDGEDGPENWGSLSPEFVQCIDGTAQSPIDISDATELDLVEIAFDYDETPLTVTNNGHAIQVDVAPGSTITYNGIAYDLLQFHFHHPSEHSVDGERADMELHLVHRDQDSGNLAVVGVLLTMGEADNAAYAPIFDNLPAAEGESVDAGQLEIATMLPESQTYFTYQGSLTTPPCSEIVRWLLLDTPVTLSAEQVAAFADIFEMNARPVQPRGNRDLLHDSN